MRSAALGRSMPKTIRQTVTIPAPPHAVYEALLDSREHSAFTGAAAKISRRVGGTFSVFDGWAHGKIVSLEKDARIVETWRTEDFANDAPDSTVSFTIRPHRGGSRLTFVHSGVPDGEYTDLKQGWIDYYWKPLQKYFQARRP